MAAEIANMAGASELRITNLAWEQYISGSATDYDIAIAGTTITEERKAIFDFTVPYFESNLGVAIQAEADVTQDNLLSQRIGVLQGNMGANYVQSELGVQPQLFQTARLALRQGSKIQYRKINRFFYFIGKLAGENHPGNVGLDDFKASDGMRIQRGILQCGN